MKSLKELVFQHTEVSSLEPVRELDKLSIVYCENTRVTSEEVRKFAAAKPECEVYGM